MKTIQLNINRVRSIQAANFVSRQPPYQWAMDLLFSPTQHFLYFQLDGCRGVGIDDEVYRVKPGDLVFYYGNQKFFSPVPEDSYRAMNVSFPVEPEDAMLSETAATNVSLNPNCLYLPFIFKARLNSSIHFLFEEIVYSFLSAS